MSFKSIAIIDIGSISIGIIVGIVMAWNNFEYWSLVGMRIASSLSTVIMLWSFCRWRPGMPVYGAEILPMIKFGSHITGFNMVNYFARNFDNILLGKFYGTGTLGLYSKAYSLMMLPIHQIRQPLNSVALPALSRVQDDPNQFKSYYIKMLTFIGFITMPIMVFMFINAKHFIYLVLGSQWLGTVDIFKILCINAFIHPSMSTTGLVLISLGQSKRYFILGIINSLIIVFSFVVGLPWGAIGVAKSYTIAIYLILIPTLWYSYIKSPISFLDFFTASLPSAFASLGMGFVIFVLQGYLSNMSDIESIIYSFIAAFLAYLVILLLIPGGLSVLKQVASYRNYLFKRRA
jgi:PST family polysaccharide transporter